MVDEDVVTDAVAPRPPDQRNLLLAEKIAGGPDVIPVAPFEGDVMHLVGLAVQHVQGVMIGTAAQEGEEVAHPVRNTETEYLDQEIDAALDVANFERNMSKSARTDTVRLRAPLRNGAFADKPNADAFRTFE
jgi:hypothetical protein